MTIALVLGGGAPNLDMETVRFSQSGPRFAPAGLGHAFLQFSRLCAQPAAKRTSELPRRFPNQSMGSISTTSY